MRILQFTLLFISALSFSVATHADEKWHVERIKHDFYLINKDDKYKIDFDVGTPRFVREEQLNKRFKVVIYFSGDVGTSTIISVHRCLLFDGDKYIANVPYSYGYKGTEDFLGPTWKVSDDKIEIIDNETGQKWAFE